MISDARTHRSAYIVVDCSGPRGGPFIERYRRRDGVRVPRGVSRGRTPRDSAGHTLRPTSA
jgi:hypothetical protein